MARRTIADELIEKGEKRGLRRGVINLRQATNLELLEIKFGSVPDETRKLIKRTRDESRLKRWIERIMSGQTWDEMELTSES